MRRAPRWVIVVLQWYVTVALLPLLLLLNARALMTEAYLRWEYNRPNFPADRYGFTTEDRLTYAPLAADYLLNNAGIEFLGEQTFPDGETLYNERELMHMYDVKVVTRQLFGVGIILLAGFLVSEVVLVVCGEARGALRVGVLRGGFLALMVLVGGMLMVFFAFDALFVQFHRLFFEGDSWIFAYSDTLIRLFPERFWIDAFAFVFGGALVEAVLLSVVAWALRRPSGGPEAAG